MDTAALKTASQRGENVLRADLLSLIKSCPVNENNPKDCPLYPLRMMKPRQRLQWFNTLNKADLVYLASYHHVCMNIRVALKSAGKFPS